MNIILDKKDNTNASLKVKVEPVDYEDSVKKKIKEYGKTASIKGFRPGKVPPQVIKRMIGKNLVADEVFSVLSKSLREYIKEENIQIVGDPLPAPEEKNRDIDWDKESSFEFTYDIGIIPEFDLEVSDKVKVQKYAIELTDKELDETIDNVRDQYGEHTHPEEVSENDYITGTIKSKDGDFEKNTMLPLNKMESKYQKQFIGQKKGDTVTFDVRKAFDKDDSKISMATGVTKEEAKDIKGDYDFEIEEITHQEKAELNQEFFDKLFGPDTVKSEEEFRDKIKEISLQNYEKDTQAKFYMDIRDALVDKTKIDIPDDFFKRWLLEVNKESLTSDKLEEDYKLYEKELKWTLIRNRVSENNDITAQDEEVVKKASDFVVSQYLGGQQITPELEPAIQNFVANYLKENEGKNYMKHYEEVLNDKVFDHLANVVSVKEKSVKVDEFKKILEKEK